MILVPERKEGRKEEASWGGSLGAGLWAGGCRERELGGGGGRCGESAVGLQYHWGILLGG